MQAFAGTFQHTLDDKGRVILPARFREQFSTGVVLAKSQEYCLEVWTTPGFERRVEELREWQAQGDKRRRHFMRIYLSGAHNDTPDSQGRLTVPQDLRDYADLDRELAIIGQGNRLEIWDRAAWFAFLDDATPDFADLDIPA